MLEAYKTLVFYYFLCFFLFWINIKISHVLCLFFIFILKTMELNIVVVHKLIFMRHLDPHAIHAAVETCHLPPSARDPIPKIVVTTREHPPSVTKSCTERSMDERRETWSRWHMDSMGQSHQHRHATSIATYWHGQHGPVVYHWTSIVTQNVFRVHKPKWHIVKNLWAYSIFNSKL